MLRKYAMVSKGRDPSKISAPTHVSDPGGGREKEQASVTGEDKLQRLRTPQDWTRAGWDSSRSSITGEQVNMDSHKPSTRWRGR